MTAAEFKAELKNVNLLDIRTPREWDELSLGGFHVSLDTLLERIDEISKEKNWVIICYNGTQSLIAMRLLKAKGFTNIDHLEGGLEAYLSL
ncbi:rhodanese-like domain-containing protein [Aquirufa sp. HETE-40SA]|jgi:rhodanese-related sulfurtransferase